MSGGSYDYLYIKDAGQLFDYPVQLEAMANRLGGLGYAEDAARDAFDLLAIIRTQNVRIEAARRRLEGVFKAVEWWDSSDWSEDDVKEALAKYRDEL